MGDIQTIDRPLNCLDVPHTTEYLGGPGVVPWDPVNWPLMAGLISITYMCASELLFRVLASPSIRKVRDLYYWSLVAGSIGCIVHITGSTLKFLVDDVSWVAPTTLIIIGWWGLICGQSLVLYSRIHLVVSNRKVILGLRAAIATVFAGFLIPSPLMTMYLSADSTNSNVAAAWAVVERAQLCCFLALETALSLTYVVATARVLQTNAVIKVKKVVRFLIITNTAILALDVIVLSMQLKNWYAMQATLKPAVYAIKFKLELAFLSQLIYITDLGFDFVQGGTRSSSFLDKKGESVQLGGLKESHVVPSTMEAEKPASQQADKPTDSVEQLQRSAATGAYRPSRDDSSKSLSEKSLDDRQYVDPEASPIDEENWPSDEAGLGTTTITRVEASRRPKRSNFASSGRRYSLDDIRPFNDRFRRTDVGTRDFAPHDPV